MLELDIENFVQRIQQGEKITAVKLLPPTKPKKLQSNFNSPPYNKRKKEEIDEIEQLEKQYSKRFIELFNLALNLLIKVNSITVLDISKISLNKTQFEQLLSSINQLSYLTKLTLNYCVTEKKEAESLLNVVEQNYFLQVLSGVSFSKNNYDYYSSEESYSEKLKRF